MDLLRRSEESELGCTARLRGDRRACSTASARRSEPPMRSVWRPCRPCRANSPASCRGRGDRDCGRGPAPVPVLTDDDLAEIALTHSQGHLIAMAERSAPRDRQLEVLVDRGGDAVLRLPASSNACVSPPGARARLAQRVLKIAVEIADHGDQPARQDGARATDRDPC